MTMILKTTPVLLGCWLLAVSAAAQTYPPVMLDPALLKFFPEDAAFSAALEISSSAPTYRWPVKIAVRGLRTRVEMDIAQMQEQAVEKAWTNYVSKMAVAGTAKSIRIFNPDRRCLYTLWPQLKGYVEDPIPADALAELAKRPKPHKVVLGAEEIGGRTATKTRLVFSRGKMDVWRTWESPEAIVWAAKDAPAVPLQIVVVNSLGETNATLVFSEISSRKPDTALFAPAKGFEKLDEQTFSKRIMEKWPKDQ